MYKCPICNKETCSEEPEIQLPEVHVRRSPIIRGECKICGEFEVSKKFLNEIAQEGYPRYLISGFFRNITEELNFGLRREIIRVESIENLKQIITFPLSPMEKLDLLLLYFFRKQVDYSKYITINEEFDYSICFSHNDIELISFLKTLYQKDLIETFTESPFQKYGNGSEGIVDHDFKLTFNGWETAYNLSQNQFNSKQAFIAMHFDDDAEGLLENGFYPALKACGYTPYSSLMDEHNESITDIIIVNIRKSGLLIADLTGARQNVYYEAGFAKGLGIPVIFTCQEDHFLADSKFDVDHIKHVKWKDARDLKEKLINRIGATGLSKV